MRSGDQLFGQVQRAEPRTYANKDLTEYETYFVHNFL